MAIKSKLLLFTIFLLSHLSSLVYVMILSKNNLWKISIKDEFEKINYVGRHSAARHGRGFQTRPYRCRLNPHLSPPGARTDFKYIRMLTRVTSLLQQVKRGEHYEFIRPQKINHKVIPNTPDLTNLYSHQVWIISENSYLNYRLDV